MGVTRAARPPFLPATLATHAALDTSDAGSFDKLVAMAREDPGFAVALLREANSVLHRRARACLGLREAVTRIGVLGAYEVLVAEPVVRVVLTRTRPAVGHLVEHSLQVARGAEFLAQLTEGVEPGVAYAAGLLHDIGHYRHIENATHRLVDLDAAHWQTPDEVPRVEQELGHDEHAALGARDAQSWDLPAALVYTIRHHHTPPSRLDPRLQALVQHVRWADGISIALLRGGQLKLPKARIRSELSLPPPAQVIPHLVEVMKGTREP